ncbi:MAG TPA: hypothetical protein VEX60_12660 [Pyrinomonadaceae bacterium]|nr:hypothetical protein [Pyrinomonadaceae bacterium]
MKMVRVLAYALQILVGVLLFRPDGVFCIACTAITIGQVIGVLSIVLGGLGLFNEFRGGVARG